VRSSGGSSQRPRYQNTLSTSTANASRLPYKTAQTAQLAAHHLEPESSEYAINSPAQVDVIAGTLPCPLCTGTLRLVEHAATTVGSVRLRVARLVCTACRAPRAVWFRLGESALH